MVLRSIPHASLQEAGWESEIIIVDGKSTDNSQQIGTDAGCTVLVQPTTGKGEAVRFCLCHSTQL
ncbi:MAG: glycosyltransferase [Candidatus Poseidoniaceae archaeon]